MTKLTELRSRLAHLRRRRQWVRWGTAYAALGLAVLWPLAAAFAVDVTLEMSKPQRLLTLLVVAGFVVWAARRFTLPWLGHRESDLDMALLVERATKDRQRPGGRVAVRDRRGSPLGLAPIGAGGCGVCFRIRQRLECL